MEEENGIGRVLIHEEAKKACVETFKEVCKDFHFRDKDFLSKLEEKLDSKKDAISTFMKKKFSEAEESLKAEEAEAK